MSHEALHESGRQHFTVLGRLETLLLGSSLEGKTRGPRRGETTNYHRTCAATLARGRITYHPRRTINEVRFKDGWRLIDV
jgi:hypothetical protein